MMSIRDTNNPLEVCCIEISDASGISYPGLFEVVGEKIKIWFLLNAISIDQKYGLCEVLNLKQFHTLKITSNQGNYITCFQSSTTSPLEVANFVDRDGRITKRIVPLVPNGLLMMESENWVEDLLVENLNESCFKRAVFSFAFLPYWFRKSIEPNSTSTIKLANGFSLSFNLQEASNISKFELRRSQFFFSKVIINSDVDHSILDYYLLQRDLLLLFRFCTGLSIPKATVTFERYDNGYIRHFKFHYVFPLDGLDKEPNANKYVKTIIPLNALINNPDAIQRWIDCVRKYEHAMMIMGEAFFSDTGIISDKVLQLIKVFDRLNKAYVYGDKKDIKLHFRLNSYINKYKLCFKSITDLDNDQICEIIKNYRNSESHGDNTDVNLSFYDMKRIMEVILISLIRERILVIPENENA